MGSFPEAGVDAIFDLHRNRFVRAIARLKDLNVSSSFEPVIRNFLQQASNAETIANIRYADRLADGLVSDVTLTMLFHEIARTFRDPASLLLTDVSPLLLTKKWEEKYTGNASGRDAEQRRKRD